MSDTQTPAASSRGFAALLWVAAILLFPAAYYVNLYFRQHADAIERNTRVVTHAVKRFEKNLDNAYNMPLEEGLERRYRPIAPVREAAECGDPPAPVRVVARGHEVLLFPERTEPRTEALGKEEQPRCFRLRMDWILDQVPLDTTLDMLMVVNGQGEVVAQTESEHHRLTNLSQLEPGDENGKSIDSSGSLRKVRFAGLDDLLTCQPLRLSTPYRPAEVTGDWAICGLVSSEKILTNAMAVRPQGALVLFLSFVFGIVSWPILKLFFMDRRERFRFIDAYFLALATFVVLLLASILCVDAAIFSGFREDSKKFLGDLATEVREGLKEEIRSLYGQLVEYDEDLSSGKLEKLQETEPGGHHGNSESRGGRWVNLKPSPLREAEGYQYFELVFWAWLGDGENAERNERGQEFAKGTIRRRNPRYVNVWRRGYFKAVREGRLWSLGDAKGFAFEPVHMISTGELQAVLAKPSDVERAVDRKAMAGIVAPLDSIKDPVLPYGFAFAVIDAEGRVLFHSDPRRALYENLVEAIDGGERLREAMKMRRPLHFRTRYAGSRYQFFVTSFLDDEEAGSFSGIPWSVVTMRDLSTLNTIHLEALLEAIYYALVYLVIAVIVSVVVIVVSKQPGGWLWPFPGAASLYRHLISVYGLAIVIFVVVIGSSGHGLILCASILLPAIIVLMSIYRLNHLKQGVDGRDEKPPHDERYLRRYFVFGFLLWIIVAVLPGLGFLRVAWEDQIQLTLWVEGVHLREGLAKRRAAVEGHYRDTELAEELTQRGVENGDRLRFASSKGGVRFSVVESDLGKDAEIFNFSRMLSIYADYLPCYNETSRRIRVLQRSLNGDEKGDGDGGGSRLLYSRGGQTMDDDSLNILTRCSEQVFRFGWPMLVAVLILLPLLGCWVRYGGRRILFGDVNPQDPKDLETLLGGGLPAHTIAWISSPYDRPGVSGAYRDHLILDLAAKRLRRPRGAKSKGKKRCVYLDVTGDGSEIRKGKLENLERLVEASPKGSVVLVTDRDPFETWLWPSKASPERPALSEEEKRRWSELLSGFVLQPVTAKGHRACGEDGVLESAEPYYREVWRCCSEEEKLVLVQLAEEGYVNPHQQQTVKRLLRRGLVTHDRGLSLFNETFALFVRRAHEPEEIKFWERKVAGFGWRHLRWAFVGLLGVVALFLFATQRSFFEGTVGYLSALAVAVPALLQLGSHLASSLRVFGSQGP